MFPYMVLPFAFSNKLCSTFGSYGSHILSCLFFNPFAANRYFTAPATEIEKAQQDGLFRKILNKSLTFHFWNSLTSALIPEQESLVNRLIDHTCIRCFDVL
jgi:hypothetical protein